MTTRYEWSRLLLVMTAAVLFISTNTAEAQTNIVESAYVTGGTFVGVKRFSGDPTEGILDGTVTGVAVAIGTSIGTRWDLQVGLDVGGFSETGRPRDVTFQREMITLNSIAENQVLSVATLLRFRSAAHGRVRLGYLGGLSFVRLHRRFHTEAPEGTPAGLIPRPDERVDYSAAPTVGLDARIAITEHLSVVPGIQACVFRFADESGLVVRPRVSVRWGF